MQVEIIKKYIKMDSIDSLVEEKKLLTEAKYRAYMSNIDKALRNFEYSSEWADLISALGKLSKAISSNTQYQVIPRRIKISKRLAQCMHPALPSGVHLKALETYAVIFSKTGPERLATELFIYSAGLFPLLGYAAMNVRPALLGIYEKYFVPLGEKLRPALSGFLSGVLPGYESGLDHFERTNALLTQICNAVTPQHFYTVLWECVATNAVIRLPAITYLLEHINKRVDMAKQLYIMGHNTENMISALCACLNDTLILVQRNTLEFLLIGFPMHTPYLSEVQLVSLVTNSLNTILRRDMSLNRRLYSWLLGSEIVKNSSSFENISIFSPVLNETYFDKHSKEIVIQAIICTLKLSLNSSPVDLRPYRIMISLLDKAEIGSAILDFVLCDIIRTMALSSNNLEVVKSANLLFASFEPAYIWCFITSIFEKICKKEVKDNISNPNIEQYLLNSNSDVKFPCIVGSGDPSLLELCFLTEFLLETISLEMYNETTRVYLPKVLLAITKMLTIYIDRITVEEVVGSLKLCMRIVSRVQPMITSPQHVPNFNKPNLEHVVENSGNECVNETNTLHILEKSKSDSKLNQSGNDMQSILSLETQEESLSYNFNKPFLRTEQKKKKSKSYSKLFELDKEVDYKEENKLFDGSNFTFDVDSQISIKKIKAKGKGNLRSSPKKNKFKNKISNHDEILNDERNINPSHKESLGLNFPQIDNESVALSDYTILENCITQYEEFFEKFLSREVFQDFCKMDLTESHSQPNENPDWTSNNAFTNNIFMDETVFKRVCSKKNEQIEKLFDTLKVDTESRSKKLELLLCQTIQIEANESYSDSKDSILNMKEYSKSTLSTLKSLMEISLDKFVKFALKLACNLLVEMSTFPNCNRHIVLDSEDKNIPNWLKVLSLIGCYVKNDIELQIIAITTLFDLISLLKSQIGHTTSPGVSFVVMLPLLKSCHVAFLEEKTRTFQMLSSNLWYYLGETGVDSDQIVLLLYQLHNCLESGLVETVISKTFNEEYLPVLPYSVSLSDNKQNALKAFEQQQLRDQHLVCMFPTLNWAHKSNMTMPVRVASKNLKKFEIVWHLGREKQSQKSFEKTLLKVLDRLCLPQYSPDHIFVSNWLQNCLLRGDLSRLLKPLYKILLSSNSKRIGIMQLNHSMKIADDTFSVLDDCDDMSEGLDAAYEHDICAISSEQGNIKYHIETYGNKKHSPIRNLQKKVFGVALSNKNKTSNFVSSTNTLGHSVEIAHDCTKIGLIVNPLQNQPEFVLEKNIDESHNNSCKADVNDSAELSDGSESSTVESDSEKKENVSETERNKHSGLSSTASGTSNVKRFVGDCEVVTELLSQHERTKNRKTYHLIRDKYQDEKSECTAKPQPNEKIEQDNVLFHSIASVAAATEKIIDRTNLIHIEKKFDRSKKSKSPDVISKKSKKSDSINQCNVLNKIGTENSNETETESKIDDTQKNKSLTINVEDKRRNLSLETSKCTSDWDLSDEVLEKSKENVQILRQNVVQNAMCSKRSSTKSSNSGVGMQNNSQIDPPHCFHSQMLLYITMYDTNQVLYAFQTLRNVISSDSRSFLCLAITTPLNSAALKQLLSKHRRSILGKGFEGNIANSDYTQNYRGCMHIEVLITLCLYYARSYFYAELNEHPTKTPAECDILGNSRVQLESFELLTLICHELIDIVKSMGRGLASFIADLMTRCKLQKIILHCLNLSVHSFNQNFIEKNLPEEIIEFNCPKAEPLFIESLHIQILKCLTEIIKLEYEVAFLKTENGSLSSSSTVKETSSTFYPLPLSASDLELNTIVYEHNRIISQQPLFLSSILYALGKDKFRHLHRNWTDLITSCLNCFSSGSLKNVVISVVYQLCNNIEDIIKETCYEQGSFYTDYLLSQLEALTILCHYCLLDNTQQTTLSHLFNQAYPQTNVASSSSNTGQIFNNIVNSILSSNSVSPQTDPNILRNPELQVARSSVLRHLPRIMSTITTVFENKLGNIRQVRQQLMEFLSPISLHHGAYFLASISLTWQERGEEFRIQSPSDCRNSTLSVQDQFLKNSTLQICPDQQNLVNLLSTIRVMPMDSLVHTLHQVVKTPPAIHKKNEKQNIELSCLELFYFYMKSAPATQIGDAWSALLALLREGTALSAPSQFVLLMILNDFVQRSPQIPFHDKKDVRDLHDVTSRLVESLSNIAGACLEQTNWLRRNLAVKEDISLSNIDGSMRDNANNLSIQQFSLQAQSVLASIVANLLDVAYGSQEKEKVTAIVTTLLYNITPYLKNHTKRNVPSFYACSILVSSFSSYQYTRKSWRKDILELLLDNAFFQMDISCLPYWKQIMDSLMTYDNTTFRELMNRVSLTQTGSLNIFTSREQEYEQRSMLLKRLAFVIFCSDFDQYNKYMPEIQEQLVNSLRLLSMVPSVQAAVFLCFRVLLLRMSADNVTSLWPIIIAEMVQVFLSMEQELKCEIEEAGQACRLSTGSTEISGLMTSSMSLASQTIHWRSIQLEACKLLEMGCILPAVKLPHFQMYRWAFVGTEFDTTDDLGVGSENVGDMTSNNHYVPHVRRIYRLMEKVYSSEKLNIQQQRQSSRLLITFQSISSLQELHNFFKAVCNSFSIPKNFNTDKEVSECLIEIEKVLSNDFLEKMSTTSTPK